MRKSSGRGEKLDGLAISCMYEVLLFLLGNDNILRHAQAAIIEQP